MKQFEKNSTFKFSINSAFKKIAVLVFSLTILSSLVSYTLVLGKEKELSKLHTITHNIQMDNVDIRNDVEFTRSLYNVHYQSKSLSYLKKPDKIIEIDLSEKILKPEEVISLARENDEEVIWDVTNGFHEAYEKLIEELSKFPFPIGGLILK